VIGFGHLFQVEEAIILGSTQQVDAEMTPIYGGEADASDALDEEEVALEADHFYQVTERLSPHRVSLFFCVASDFTLRIFENWSHMYPAILGGGDPRDFGPVYGAALITEVRFSSSGTLYRPSQLSDVFSRKRLQASGPVLGGGRKRGRGGRPIGEISTPKAKTRFERILGDSEEEKPKPLPPVPKKRATLAELDEVLQKNFKPEPPRKPQEGELDLDEILRSL